MRGAGFPLGAAPGRAWGVRRGRASRIAAARSQAAGRAAAASRGSAGGGSGPRRGGRPRALRTAPSSPRPGRGPRACEEAHPQVGASRQPRPRRPPPPPRPRSPPTCRSPGLLRGSSRCHRRRGAGMVPERGWRRSPDVTARPHLRAVPRGENGVKFLQVPLCSLGKQRCPDRSRSCQAKPVCAGGEIPGASLELRCRLEGKSGK